MVKPPYLLGGLALFAGYFWAVLRRIERPVSRELMQYHRRDQVRKLRSILRTLLSGRQVNAFRAGADKDAASPAAPPST